MKCCICGKEIEKSNSTTCLCSHKCFEEYFFWKLLLEEKDSHIVINGNCYKVGDENDKSCFRGCAGREFKIRNLSTNETFLTTNLWCQGKIPERFLPDLPDTHEFI